LSDTLGSGCGCLLLGSSIFQGRKLYIPNVQNILTDEARNLFESRGIKMDYYGIIEKARKTGKVDKGTNEVTKAIERGVAKAVFYAADVSPKEIVAHLAFISKEKGIPAVEVDSKQKLGIAVGIPVSTSSVAIIEAGDASSDISKLKKESGHGSTAAAKE
jgi:large subunit ribosomal protein L7Ae